MFIVKVTGTTTSCKECPFRRYYSGGAYECMKAGAHLPEGKEHEIPAWCPLGDYPAIAMQKQEDRIIGLEEMIRDLQNPKRKAKDAA